jgi:myo-inositol-1(or 4)-monophosphatase
LEHKGEIVAGVIFDPIKDEMFVAEKGQGAWLNDRRIRVSASGFPAGARSPR